MSQFWLLRPRGPLAHAGFVSILVDVGVMMLIIGPTTLLLMWCMWRYHHSSRKGPYTPSWTNSLSIEIVSWGFPLAIVAFLSFYAYRSTYAVDPFNPGLLAAGRGSEGPVGAPIDIDVITTDWQWLFIYPDRHVASANELVVPVHTPVRFRLTSATVPNDIYIPQLVGEIDIMPGMLTRQGLMANQVGTFEGFAADYSGPGFSWMQFKTRVLPRADFDRCVGDMGQSPIHLDQATFDTFAQPTINTQGKTIHFSQVEDGMLRHVLQNVMAGKDYPTPPDFTEKKSAYDNGRRQKETVGPSYNPHGASN